MLKECFQHREDWLQYINLTYCAGFINCNHGSSFGSGSDFFEGNRFGAIGSDKRKTLRMIADIRASWKMSEWTDEQITKIVRDYFIGMLYDRDQILTNFATTLRFFLRYRL